MNPQKPFNPLDKINLAKSIDTAFCEVRPIPLGSLREFKGAGIYALYYVGNFPCYGDLSEVNRKKMVAPIYVGKAEASGKRKGGFLDESASGNSLYKRLSDHAKSIVQANNLCIDDFFCRYMVVDETWIALGESMLISKYSPVWNACVDGFGNHNPGRGRKNGARPKWDMVHPGREWAQCLPENPESVGLIKSNITLHLKNNPPFQFADFSELDYHIVSWGEKKLDI